MILQGFARPHKCKFFNYQKLIFEKQKTLSVLRNKHIMNSLNSEYKQISSVFRQNRFQNMTCYVEAKRMEALLKNKC